MGVRRLAWLWVLAACPAKSSAPVTTPVPAAPAAPTAGSGSSAAAAPVPAPAPAPAPPVPSGPESNATLAEVGIEAASLDRSVDPCVDFYQFACGGWIATNKIPAEYPMWSRFGELDEKNRVALQAILEETAKTPGTKLGDYWTSCMDEAGIEKAGTASIKPLLAKTQAVKDAKTWFAALSELHKAGVVVVWQATADADLSDATRYVTWLDTGGLGLPDRDYYVKPELADHVTGYKQHVSRMLALAAVASPDLAAADVVAIEIALAKLTKTATERRDLKALNNPIALKALAKQAKSVDWKAYFKALGITPSAKLLVTTPAFFAALDKLRKDVKPAQWASYFTYHLLRATAPALPKAFDDEMFALRKQVSGVTEKLARNKRCVRSAATALGELLGKQYVDKHLPPETKPAAAKMFDAIVKVMNTELSTVEWMSEPTRKTAQAKLAKLVPMIGYPDKWRGYDFAVKRDDFAGNLLRATAFETKRKLAKSGKPYDRDEWQANTFGVDAYYNPSANNTALLAGILQGPFFGPNRGVAANLGGIGMVIGHELTHGFDDQGAQFDATGNLEDWWAPADKTKFEAKGQCVADQYATFEVLPKQFINGKLTLGENIADMGGTKMAFKAYRALRKDAPPIVANGFTEDQQFFLATAQVWCAKLRPEAVQQGLTSNPHSPPKFRVYGALRNLPEFAQAFSCAAGTPMRPTQTCSVW